MQNAVGELCDLPMVFCYESAEFSLATNFSLVHGDKVLVENNVVSSFALMWAKSVVMSDPSADNIISLSWREADDVVEDFLFKTTHPTFNVSVCFGRTVGRAYAAHVLTLPEGGKGARKLSVSVMNQVLNFDSVISRIPLQRWLWHFGAKLPEERIHQTGCSF